MRAKGRRLGVVDALGVIAAIVGWLGWFQVAPALGFPTIGPAAMVNRVFVPHSNPGAWIGWTILVVGLAIVVALYEVLAARGLIPRGAVFGLLFGVAAWAVGGGPPSMHANGMRLPEVDDIRRDEPGSLRA